MTAAFKSIHQDLIDACKNVNYDLFVNTGSVFEYGVKNSRINEGEILEPVSYYGVSKAASTLYCQVVSKREKKAISISTIATATIISPPSLPFQLNMFSMCITEGTASGSPCSTYVSLMIYGNPAKVKKKVGADCQSSWQ